MHSRAGTTTPVRPGRSRRIAIRSHFLRADVPISLWTPAGVSATEPLPLLVVHDGPEYARRAGLTRFVAGELPPHRIALLAPGDRNEWYSAAAAYSRALCDEVLPALSHGGPIVGIGASLGALALFHAQRRHPVRFAGLFLQSGSFFVPRFDAHESGFPRYRRIVRFVREVLRTPAHPDPVPIALTCGRHEENVHNNRVMARALAAQGYDATLHEVAGGHDFAGWRDALDPHLPDLLRRVRSA